MALADVGGPHWGTVALNVIGTKLQELLPDDPENSIIKRFTEGDEADTSN